MQFGALKNKTIKYFYKFQKIKKRDIQIEIFNSTI